MTLFKVDNWIKSSWFFFLNSQNKRWKASNARCLLAEATRPQSIYVSEICRSFSRYFLVRLSGHDILWDLSANYTHLLPNRQLEITFFFFWWMQLLFGNIQVWEKTNLDASKDENEVAERKCSKGQSLNENWARFDLLMFFLEIKKQNSLRPLFLLAFLVAPLPAMLC